MSSRENGYRNKLNTVCDRQRWKFKKGECVSSGPQHQTVWTGHVHVNGTPYIGQGSSKGEAWEAAARNALIKIRADHPEVVPDD